MSGCIVKAYIDGGVRKVRLHTPVDPELVDRIVKNSTTPFGGVYVIHHPPADHLGRNFYREFRDRNPGMRAYVGYTTFETDRIPGTWVETCNEMDEIWVPSHFNVETFSRSGVLRNKLHVIPHAFDPSMYRPEETPPLDLGNSKGFNFLSIFEWTYRKGWDVLIRAYIEEFSPDEDVRLILRTYQGGGVIGAERIPIVEQLRKFISGIGYDPQNIPDIELIENIVPSEKMPSLYKAADCFVLPTRGEGWGIPLTESMLMKLPVIATNWSAQQEFMNEENSYPIRVEKIVPVAEDQVRDNPMYNGHSWAEPSIRHTKELMRHVFEYRREAREKGEAGRAYIKENFSTRRIAARIMQRVNELEKRKRYRPPVKIKARKMNILFQARPNVFSLPGGDTTVMARMKKLLEGLNFKVDFSLDSSADLKHYDLVHIFNFDVPFAINAALQKKPFVVTPMYEDYRRYLLRAAGSFSVFRDAVEKDEYRDIERELGEIWNDRAEDTISSEFGFMAWAADRIFTSGESEKRRILNDFPSASDVQVLHVGFDMPETRGITADLFESTYGVKDYVLCVGRLETRKNQLMLMYALKDLDLPIVFVNSGSIQPAYEYACKRFKRKGKTIFTSRISREMLTSAYKGALVHALPSWYELPGIVSLEAAWLGCKVVTSDWGTVREYLGEHAYYCSPDDPESIKTAVMKAIHDESKCIPREKIERYSWMNEAEELARHYDDVLARASIRKRSVIREAAEKEELYHKMKGRLSTLCESDPAEAIIEANKLIEVRNTDSQLYYFRGRSYLQLMKMDDAIRDLRNVVENNPSCNVTVYLYLALALMRQEKYESAIDILRAARRRHPLVPDDVRNLVEEYLERSLKCNSDAQMGVVGKGIHGSGRSCDVTKIGV